WRALETDEMPLAEQLSRSVSEASIAEQEASIARFERMGIQVITILDDQYPLNLRMVFSRPPVLFVKGGLQATDRRFIAVVGTRQASPAGLRFASQVSSDLVALGYTVVAGLARGIDAAGHRAALAAGGQTVAVFGTGIDRVYPPEHETLAAEIGRKGALVSQFWPGTPPTRHT